MLGRLKQRAARNQRSLQKELRAILIEAAAQAPPAGPLPPLNLVLSRAVTQGSWRREEIYGDDAR